jgi:hypothetical protein
VPGQRDLARSRWQRGFSPLCAAPRLRALVAGRAAAIAAKPRRFSTSSHGIEAHSAATCRGSSWHTHRPAHHRLVVDGRACERWVLADWYDHGSYLEFDATGDARARSV